MASMDDKSIMKPKLTRIGNMCFRRLDIPNDGVIDEYDEDDNLSLVSTDHDITDDETVTTVKAIKTTSGDTQLPSIDLLEVLDDDEVKVEDMEEVNGQFEVTLKIPKMFHGNVIGRSGMTIRSIESQTRTHINVPDRYDKSVDVVITGNDRYNVRDARTRIDQLVANARNREDFNHFVSIPFTDQSIVDQFLKFKSEVLNDPQMRGITESLFQTQHRLHVTVVPLLFVDDIETSSASKILDKCLDEVIKPLTKGQPIRVKLEGLDYMNDDPTRVDVLYAKVVDASDNECLQTIVDQLFDVFGQSGLMSGSKHDFDRLNANTKVKLHVTLLNSKFSQSSDNRNQRNGRNKRLPFDATLLLKQFGDYCFGEMDIKTIEISIRGSNDPKTGYYRHTSRLEL